MRSAYPVHKIWRQNQENNPDDEIIDLGDGGISLVIKRNDNNIQLFPLAEGESDFLLAIAQGLTFSEASEKALEANADIDIP